MSVFVSHKPSLFRAKESPLNNKEIKPKYIIYHTVGEAIVYLSSLCAGHHFNLTNTTWDFLGKVSEDSS